MRSHRRRMLVMVLRKMANLNASIPTLPILTARNQLLSSQAINGLSHTILQVKGTGSLVAVNELRLRLAPVGLHSRS
jgi:hypothetical protein